MARNSRFRTTSGPSTSRPRPDKGKSFKDSGERKGTFRKEGKGGDAKRSFDKEKPFQKGGYRDKRTEPLGEKSGDFARRRVAKFPPKDNFQGGRPERSENKKRFSRDDDRGKPPSGQRSFDQRGKRPFSKGDFKRRPAGEGPKPGFKSDRDTKAKRPFESFRKDDDQAPKPFKKVRFEDGGKRRSFVESRLERQRNPKINPESEPATPIADKPSSDLIRLNKYISNSGVCSRREADDLISNGLITVNGKSITELGYKVKATDDVRYEGRRLKSEKPVYILLNKPKGYITTTDDPQERNTVMQLIQGACKERVYPVGRLDRNTSGLLLLTNDGDLTDKLTHPSYNVKKIYKAELDKPLTKADFEKIKDGVRLEEGKAMVDDLAIVSDDGKTIGVEIHIGWNRIIRRIFEALGYEVIKLDRSVYATLDKKDLSRGHWRFLRQDEIIRLKHFQ